MIMERAIGEIFGFNDVKLQVKDTGEKACCDGCYFNEFLIRNVCGIYAGYCYGPFRSDGKNVVFVEIDYDKEDK